MINLNYCAIADDEHLLDPLATDRTKEYIDPLATEGTKDNLDPLATEGN